VVRETDQRLLLIDTCGETAGVGLFAGDQLTAEEILSAGRASAAIISAIRRLLQRAGWALTRLDAIGVVSGPGSFTGVRTGMAVAKGLCEAAGLRLAAVSRLEVLADAVPAAALAALDAGRGEAYVRDVATGREWICAISELTAARDVAVGEERLLERLSACAPVLHRLSLADALPAVSRCLQQGGTEVALAEANYVRQERDIYAKPGAANSTATGSPPAEGP
jgi:tRNA threonylcarbamoyladenosine biosynthesis protein TsaB